jgi:hypothetical protein
MEKGRDYSEALSSERLAAFCAALVESGQIKKACAAVGISLYMAAKWKREIPEFAKAWEEAEQASIYSLESEATRRGYEGIDEHLTHLGRFTHMQKYKRDEDGKLMQNAAGEFLTEPILDEKGEPIIQTVKKYSDNLLMFLMKARAPEKYRDNSRVELAGQLDVSTTSDEDLKAELALLTSQLVKQGIALDDASDLI